VGVLKHDGAGGCSHTLVLRLMHQKHLLLGIFVRKLLLGVLRVRTRVVIVIRGCLIGVHRDILEILLQLLLLMLLFIYLLR
jgi:hypothetical protein